MRFRYIALATPLFGLYLAFIERSPLWYSFFVTGTAITLYLINEKHKNLEFKKEAVTLLFYLIAGIIIEFIGNTLINFWDYPAFDSLDFILHVIIIGYPATFYMLRESIFFFAQFNRILAYPLTWILGAFVVELPNLFAQEWTYRIPFITFSIFGINIIIFFGWLILVAIPVVTSIILRAYLKNI